MNKVIKVLLILIFLVPCVGCSPRLARLTLFYKQDGMRKLTNLEGEDCYVSSSGFTMVLDKDDMTITYYFKNCDVVMVRKLEQYELKQWGLEPKKD